MWKNLLSQGRRLVESVTNKQRVGVDKHGNEYVLFRNHKEDRWKRMVMYKDNIARPELVPMPWFSWLRYNRDDAPTEHELQVEDDRLTQLSKRVQELKEADERERSQQQAERRLSDTYDPLATDDGASANAAHTWREPPQLR